jgi:hypothetical protein
MKHILYGLEQVLAVVDVDAELSFDRVMYQDASFNIELVVLTVPVGLESNRHAIPSVGVDVSQTIATHSDHTLCEHMRFLVEVDVVLARVVESHSRELEECRNFLHPTKRSHVVHLYLIN